MKKLTLILSGLFAASGSFASDFSIDSNDDLAQVEADYSLYQKGAFEAIRNGEFFYLRGTHGQMANQFTIHSNGRSTFYIGQTGSFNSAEIIQVGAGIASITQSGALNDARVNQAGVENSAFISQNGSGNIATITQK